MENATAINETFVEEFFNSTITYFENSGLMIKYFPYIVSILTIVFTTWKAGRSTFKVTKTVAGSSYKVVRVIVTTLINCIMKCFGTKTEIVTDDRLDAVTSKILAEIDRQVKMIEQLTTREIEQVKLLADIYEMLKFKKDEVDMSYETNQKAYTSWTRNPYAPPKTVSLD
ncbi:NSP4 protein [Rotavirus A]|uniref:Non-structural glycoprotein 4 n=1 Tax=Rotavirus A TaxID=28875 RepID=A0A0P0YJY8_9REOV|nr:NSP4 protein [Rotavirus A]